MYMHAHTRMHTCTHTHTYIHVQTQIRIWNVPASVVQLDAHLTDDQEVESSTPAGLATLFCGDW